MYSRRGFFLILALLPAFLRAEESPSEQILREVRTQRIIVAIGEPEAFKNSAIAFMQFLQKSRPNVSALFWSRVGSGIESEKFEAAIIKHYSSHFSLDELGHLDELFKNPNMRGLLYWLRVLPAQADEEQKKTLESLRQKYGDATMAEFGRLLNSALGRELVSASVAAEEVRHEQAVAAVMAAIEKANAP